MKETEASLIILEDMRCSTNLKRFSKFRSNSSSQAVRPETKIVL